MGLLRLAAAGALGYVAYRALQTRRNGRPAAAVGALTEDDGTTTEQQTDAVPNADASSPDPDTRGTGTAH